MFIHFPTTFSSISIIHPPLLTPKTSPKHIPPPDCQNLVGKIQLRTTLWYMIPYSVMPLIFLFLSCILIHLKIYSPIFGLCDYSWCASLAQPCSWNVKKLSATTILILIWMTKEGEVGEGGQRLLTVAENPSVLVKDGRLPLPYGSFSTFVTCVGNAS